MESRKMRVDRITTDKQYKNYMSEANTKYQTKPARESQNGRRIHDLFVKIAEWERRTFAKTSIEDVTQEEMTASYMPGAADLNKYAQ